MKNSIVVAMAGVVFTVLGASSTDAQTNPSVRPVLAKQLAPAKFGTKLSVASVKLQAGSVMDKEFTQDGENHNPPVAWTKGPSSTHSYAILMGDASVNGPEPAVHWAVYNIPSTAYRVAEDQPKDAELSNGAQQGLNFQKMAGYIGPKLSAGETHQYHIQVFALNTRLNLDPAHADRNAIVNAMKDHVLASGDLVVTYTGE